MKKIAVIGFGLSGAAFFINFIEQLRKSSRVPKLEITLIDTIAVDGRGIAYRTGYLSNLLNTPSTTMGLLSDDKMHFYNWLVSKHDILQANYHGFDIIYPPRNLYGQYIEETLAKYFIIAEKLGISVVQKVDTVRSISTNNGQYNVSFTKNSPPFKYHYVIFCAGGNKKKNFPHIEHHENFFDSPYEPNFPQSIDKHSNVLILGSRLSAIDAALMLSQNNHKGKIYFISRGGLLPRVQGPLNILPKNNFTADFIQKNDPLPLSSVITAIKNDILYYEKINPTLKGLKHPKGEAISILRYEIMKSRHFRPWQNVLYNENHLVNLAWRKLDLNDKCRVYKNYIDYFSIYRAAMPLINAKKIYALMKNQQLEVLSSRNRIKANLETGCFMVETDNNITLNSKYLIDATGISYDLKKNTAPLFQDAQDNQLISLNNFGGINLDGSSYEIIPPNTEQERNLYALGGLSNGIDFGTNLAEFIISSSTNLCLNLITKLEKNAN